jgi:hypothetical protein
LLKNHPQIKIRRTAAQILSQPQTLDYIKTHTKRTLIPQILVFKPSPQIDNLFKIHQFTLLANPYPLNKLFEDKTSFYQSLESHPQVSPHLIPHLIAPLHQIRFSQLTKSLSLPLVLQYGRGWAGNSTFLIDKPTQLQQLTTKWPNRIVKITPLISGPTFINNACITRDQVLISPPAIQLRQPTTDNRLLFSTLGRQWPAQISQQLAQTITHITHQVGQLMSKSGYLGYFGLDFLLDSKTNQLYLQECNARLTASFGFYTQLEKLSSQTPLLEHHLQSFSSQSANSKLSTSLPPKALVKGSQLSIRNLTSKPIKANHSLSTGLYQFQNHQLKFLQPTLDLAPTSPHQFILIPPPNNSIIPPHQLLFSINTLHPFANNQGHLTPKALRIIRTINHLITVRA